MPTPPRPLPWPAVVTRRLTRHHLHRPAPLGQAVAVVGAVGGLQAQVLSAAAWSLGARVAGLTQAAVRAALWERRTLVKTYGPRGTLALLPAAELPLWMAALQAWHHRRAAHWYADAGLSPAQGEDLLAAIAAALDGQCLTRPALAQVVAARLGPWAAERLRSTWGELLPPAAFTGRLCFGPSQGSQVTFVRADQWRGGNWEVIDPEAALREVARRFLSAYGPATAHDFGHWFWLKPDEAQAVFTALGDELVTVEFEGRPAYLLAADAARRWTVTPSPLRLLPQYDVYVFAAGPRERVVPPAVKPPIFALGRGRYEGATGLPVLLVEGIVAGVWQSEEKSGRSVVRVQAFAKLSADQRAALAAEVGRLSAFWEQPATLRLGPLTRPPG